MIRDHYLGISYFREESCLSSETVVNVLGTGKCKRRGESVMCKQENENLQNISVC